MDFQPVAEDTAQGVLEIVKYILKLKISPTDKRAQIAQVINLIGADFYAQMFDACSEVFDSAALGTTDYNEMAEQAERLARKVVRQNALNRPIGNIVQGYYNTALGKAQSEAFQNALSLDRHPTLTRTVLGTCCKWCRSKAGTYINPGGEDFARHANCNCLFTVSGYKSRNGILNNYVRSRNSPERQAHLEPTLRKLYDNPSEATIKIAQLLEGQKNEVVFGNIRLDGSRALNVNRKAEIVLNRDQAMHIDKSGHLSGTGYITRAEASRGVQPRVDATPLTVDEITQIPEIVKHARASNTIEKTPQERGYRGYPRYEIAGNDVTRQIVIVDKVNPKKLSIVTSYKAGWKHYGALKEAIRNKERGV